MKLFFAPAELMEEMLGNKIGAATVFGTLLDLDRDVQVIIDKEVANEDYYGCSDGTTTCYLKLRTADIIDKFLPFSKHKPVIIEIQIPLEKAAMLSSLNMAAFSKKQFSFFKYRKTANVKHLRFF